MKRKILALSFLLTAQQILAQDITSNLEAYFSFNDGTANVTSGQVTNGGTTSIIVLLMPLQNHSMLK